MNGCKLTKLVLVVGIALLALILLGGVLSVPAQVGMVALPAHALSRAEGPASIPATTGPINAAAPAAPEVGAENVELVGHIGGETYAVFVRGNYAYVGEGPALVILDISDPASPTVVGRTAPLPDIVEDICVSGDYAYVADGEDGGLQVVDVSDPAAPVKASWHPFSGSVSGVTVAGDYAYLAVGSDGLWVVDVSNPIQPALVDRHEPPGVARDVVVAGSYAYVAAYGYSVGGLWVVDISDSHNLREVALCDTHRYGYGVAVADGYAYVADYHEGLWVLDVSTPTSPTCEVSLYDTPGLAQGVAVAGDYAYVADGGQGLRVVDVSTPMSPTEAGACDTPGYAYGVAVTNGYAYVADEDSLQVMNVSDPAHPAQVGSYDAPVTAYDVAVAGGYAYVGDSNGVEIVDVFPLTNPAGVGFCDTGAQARDVAVAGDYAYLADGDLRVVRVARKDVPTVFGYCSTPGVASGVAVSGSYAYVADGSSGLQVVDVSFPNDPTIVAGCDTPGYAYDVAVVGDYAYVADWSGGLRVLNISTPTSPACEVGSCDTPRNARGVAVADGFAYVADWYGGLRVVDVSEPISPTEMGYCDTPGNAQGVAAANEYAYVADGDDGVRVVDVSVPISPTEVGFYDMCGYADDVTVAGDYAYVAAESCGLFILYFTGTGSDPPAEVTISGPTTGISDTAYTFTAIVSPITAARPITYIWQATGQSPVTHTGGRSDTVSFAWSTTGTKTITVTATNALGTASGTHVITIAPPVPVERVTISGPTTGILSTTCTFTATTSPPTATQPIIYVWQATDQDLATHTGRASPQDTQTFTWTTVGSKAITVTASNAWGSADANHAIAIAGPDTCRDAYEPDDTCAQASALATDGTPQSHTFHDYADEDWAHFTVTSGITYVVQATSTSSGADLVLELYDACGGNLEGSDDDAFGNDARLLFVAPSSGTYYVRTLNHEPGVCGPGVTYELSVRAQMPGGVVLIVAGHDDHYRLQNHILYAANYAYRTFLKGGILKAHIRYLSAIDNDDRTDPDGDGVSDVYASSASANVQTAITTWAANLTDSHTPFYLYLVDHGGVDTFLTDGIGDTIAPAMLSGWLDALEAPVSVIYEACHSGSFIDGLEEISEPGRVVIASTGRLNSAYPTPGRGAYFSDAFFTALGQSQDLWTSFQEGVRAVGATGLWQTPWLDDDGDAAPNTPSDGAVARGRGLANFAFPVGRPPVVDEVLPPVSIPGGRCILGTRARDDVRVVQVWAVVYPPSFDEPEPSPDGTMPDLGLPKVDLSDSNDDGVYEGVYEGYIEEGTYRLVVYAEDSEGNLAQPAVLEVQKWQVYLPLVMR